NVAFVCSPTATIFSFHLFRVPCHWDLGTWLWIFSKSIRDFQTNYYLTILVFQGAAERFLNSVWYRLVCEEFPRLWSRCFCTQKLAVTYYRYHFEAMQFTSCLKIWLEVN